MERVKGCVWLGWRHA